MTRNSFYLIVAVLAVVVVGIGAYMVYQQSQQPSLEIRFDDNGVKVNTNGG